MERFHMLVDRVERIIVDGMGCEAVWTDAHKFPFGKLERTRGRDAHLAHHGFDGQSLRAAACGAEYGNLFRLRDAETFEPSKGPLSGLSRKRMDFDDRASA